MSLCEGGTFSCMRLISRKLSGFLFMFSTANEFIFEVFKVHHKDWLTNSGGLIDLVTRIPDSDSTVQLF